MTYRKKLIEVALPLKAINEASAREKSIRHGHPSTLHLWWARRPLAACRAVLFASLVDDPDSDPMYAGAGEEITGQKRAELFNLIEDLVLWENSNNPRVINRARAEIARSIAANKVADGEFTNDTVLRLASTLTRSVSEESTPTRSVSEESTQARSASEENSRSASEVGMLSGGGVSSSSSGASPLDLANASGWCGDATTPEISVAVRDLKNMLAAPEVVNAFLAEHAPPVLDPFCGGGSIPLEAQRLGLRAYASDLNPVAVLITKALIEIPPKFAGLPPVNPEARRERRGVRRENDALSRDDSLAEGDAGGAGGLSTGPETAARRDVRDAVADHTRGGVDPGEHRGGMDTRDGQGQGALSGDRAGIGGGSGDAADALRRPGLVSAQRHKKPSRSSRRGQPDADNHAEEEKRGKRSEEREERVKRSEEREEAVAPASLTSHSSLFTPHYRGAAGLAEDVRYYGRWMRDEAHKRIGHLYPKVPITPDMAQDRPDLQPYVGQQLTVIAWLWARTIKCPNPACGAATPLVSSFMLSSRRSNRAFVRPIVPEGAKRVKFNVQVGDGDAPPGLVNRRGVTCVFCRTAVPFEHVRASGVSEQMGQQLMAIVAEGQGGRVFLPPSSDHENTALQCERPDFGGTNLPDGGLGFRVQRYGITKHRQLFTARQLAALCALADLTKDVRSKVLSDARACYEEHACGPALRESLLHSYADAVTTYLALAVSKAADLLSSLCHWQPNPEHLKLAPTFTRPTLSMKWDFAEGNPFSSSSGNFGRQPELIEKVVATLADGLEGMVEQRDAQAERVEEQSLLISTDPPYYDNIGYADLSDVFYVWLRRMLQPIYPMLFSTVLVPKGPELISDPSRHGSQENGRLYFERGLEKTFNWARAVAQHDFPFSVYYAFKQSEEDSSDDSGAQSNVSTGWEAMLEGLVRSSITITGTWPVRTERPGRPRDNASNALASSIVLICRTRPESAPIATRKDFMNALRAELPEALKNLQHGNIAPVDLAQAAIGPGMAVFTRYAKVVEADGSAMSVRTALGIINQVLDEVLAEQEGEFDPDTRWALAWFAEYGMNDGPFGVAETLSKAKNTAVAGLVEAGVVKARAGKVKLVGRAELPDGWDPGRDGRLTVWETTQHLIRALETQGESGAAALLARLGGMGETARELAYRLYTLCERKKWADEALAYNGLVIAWPELAKLAHARRTAPEESQREMFH